MKTLLTYKDFVNESVSGKGNVTISKRIKIKFDIDWNESIGKVEDEIVLAMSPDSTGMYSIGEDVEKFCGIPEKDVIRDVKAGKESPEDAIIYGMSNTMNGGADIYFWTNGTRLSGAAVKSGLWPAIIEQISHECIHLTRQILTRAIAKKRGANIPKGEWITFDFGCGEYCWPAVGDPNDKTPKLIVIDEEAFATATGLVIQQITDEFLKMASSYIPELKMIIKG